MNAQADAHRDRNVSRSGAVIDGMRGTPHKVWLVPSRKPEISTDHPITQALIEEYP